MTPGEEMTHLAWLLCLFFFPLCVQVGLCDHLLDYLIFFIICFKKKKIIKNMHNLKLYT